MNAMALQLNDKFFSVKEAAAKLGVTPGRVRQLVVEGRITPLRLSRELIIPQSEIFRYERDRRPYRKSEMQ
jgi:excisionase family DNA binding protein